MKCVICKHGEPKPGTATVTLERDAVTVVFKSVPATICDNCGEEYVDDAIGAQLLKAFNAAAHEGVLIDVREFAVV